MTSNHPSSRFTARRAIRLVVPIVAMAAFGVAASSVPANADWPPGEPDSHAANCNCSHVTAAQQAQRAYQAQRARATRMAEQGNAQTQQR